MSPPRACLARAFSSPASSSLPPRTLLRYCVRTSCASIITSPLSISWPACQISDSQARAEMLKCYSSCRRVRSPDPWASVGYETFQDAIVQAGCDAPTPPARAIELEAPPLAHFGHGCLFEGAQAARRQRPHVDLVLGLAYGDERGIGPESAPPPLARFALCFSAHLRSPSPPSCANLYPYAAPLRSSRCAKASSSGCRGSGSFHIAPHTGHSNESS